MNSQRAVAVTRWAVTSLALAGIVLVYSRWLHVNPTTVALTLVLFILVLAAKFSLRYAVGASIVAAGCFNFFFLPPVDTFTVTDPQNWLALLTFLGTSVIGSRLSQRARDEAEEARARQREIEILFTLSRELLQAENVAALVNTLPSVIAGVSSAESVALFLLQGDRFYQSGKDMGSMMDPAHLRQLALTLTGPEILAAGESRIPLRSGVRPRGMLMLRGVTLSEGSFRAMGGLVSIALDRVEALETVTKSEAAKESERLRTLLLDSITHELRTPLTSIKGAATTLLSNDNIAEADRRELLTIVDEESDRLNRLVSQAVEMAQLEANEVHMTFAPMTIEEAIAQARETCASVEQTHPVHLSLPALPPVMADVEVIVKVLCNLLENAAKYSAPDAPIFLSAAREGEEVLVSVADRGIGIPDEEQALIFDRLYRARSQAGTTPGTGMGLAISRAIVEAHGGRIGVTSQPGHGSVFTFSLPVAEV